MANPQEDHAPSVAGRTLEGNSSKAKLLPTDVAYSPVEKAEELEGTAVFSVNCSSSYSVQGFIQGTSTTFLARGHRLHHLPCKVRSLGTG